MRPLALRGSARQTAPQQTHVPSPTCSPQRCHHRRYIFAVNHAKARDIHIVLWEEFQLGPACIIVPFVLLAIVLFVWGRTHSSNTLEQWARDNGFKLLSVDRRTMFRGSFSWTTSEGQEVFRITVRDQHGNTRSGYVRVGGHLLGQLSDRIDVRWDS
jgi:hypothetical protein